MSRLFQTQLRVEMLLYLLLTTVSWYAASGLDYRLTDGNNLDTLFSSGTTRICLTVQNDAIADSVYNYGIFWLAHDNFRDLSDRYKVIKSKDWEVTDSHTIMAARTPGGPKDFNVTHVCTTTVGKYMIIISTHEDVKERSERCKTYHTMKETKEIVTDSDKYKECWTNLDKILDVFKNTYYEPYMLDGTVLSEYEIVKTGIYDNVKYDHGALNSYKVQYAVVRNVYSNVSYTVPYGFRAELSQHAKCTKHKAIKHTDENVPCGMRYMPDGFTRGHFLGSQFCGPSSPLNCGLETVPINGAIKSKLENEAAEKKVDVVFQYGVQADTVTFTDKMTQKEKTVVWFPTFVWGYTKDGVTKSWVLDQYKNTTQEIVTEAALVSFSGAMLQWNNFVFNVRKVLGKFVDLDRLKSWYDATKIGYLVDAFVGAVTYVWDMISGFGEHYLGVTMEVDTIVEAVGKMITMKSTEMRGLTQTMTQMFMTKSRTYVVVGDSEGLTSVRGTIREDSKQWRSQVSWAAEFNGMATKLKTRVVIFEKDYTVDEYLKEIATSDIREGHNLVFFVVIYSAADLDTYLRSLTHVRTLFVPTQLEGVEGWDFLMCKNGECSHNNALVPTGANYPFLKSLEEKVGVLLSTIYQKGGKIKDEYKNVDALSATMFNKILDIAGVVGMGPYVQIGKFAYEKAMSYICNDADNDGKCTVHELMESIQKSHGVEPISVEELVASVYGMDFTSYRCTIKGKTVELSAPASNGLRCARDAKDSDGSAKNHALPSVLNLWVMIFGLMSYLNRKHAGLMMVFAFLAMISCVYCEKDSNQMHTYVGKRLVKATREISGHLTAALKTDVDKWLSVLTKREQELDVEKMSWNEYIARLVNIETEKSEVVLYHLPEIMTKVLDNRKVRDHLLEPLVAAFMNVLLRIDPAHAQKDQPEIDALVEDRLDKMDWHFHRQPVLGEPVTDRHTHYVVWPSPMPWRSFVAKITMFASIAALLLFKGPLARFFVVCALCTVMVSGHETDDRRGRMTSLINDIIEEKLENMLHSRYLGAAVKDQVESTMDLMLQTGEICDYLRDNIQEAITKSLSQRYIDMRPVVEERTVYVEQKPQQWRTLWARITMAACVCVLAVFKGAGSRFVVCLSLMTVMVAGAEAYKFEPNELSKLVSGMTGAPAIAAQEVITKTIARWNLEYDLKVGEILRESSFDDVAEKLAALKTERKNVYEVRMPELINEVVKDSIVRQKLLSPLVSVAIYMAMKQEPAYASFTFEEFREEVYVRKATMNWNFTQTDRPECAKEPKVVYREAEKSPVSRVYLSTLVVVLCTCRIFTLRLLAGGLLFASAVSGNEIDIDNVPALEAELDAADALMEALLADDLSTTETGSDSSDSDSDTSETALALYTPDVSVAGLSAPTFGAPPANPPVEVYSALSTVFEEDDVKVTETAVVVYNAAGNVSRVDLVYVVEANETVIVAMDITSNTSVEVETEAAVIVCETPERNSSIVVEDRFNQTIVTALAHVRSSQSTMQDPCPSQDQVNVTVEVENDDVIIDMDYANVTMQVPCPPIGNETVEVETVNVTADVGVVNETLESVSQVTVLKPCPPRPANVSVTTAEEISEPAQCPLPVVEISVECNVTETPKEVAYWMGVMRRIKETTKVTDNLWTSLAATRESRRKQYTRYIRDILRKATTVYEYSQTEKLVMQDKRFESIQVSAKILTDYGEKEVADKRFETISEAVKDLVFEGQTAESPKQAQGLSCCGAVENGPELDYAVKIQPNGRVCCYHRPTPGNGKTINLEVSEEEQLLFCYAEMCDMNKVDGECVVRGQVPDGYEGKRVASQAMDLAEYTLVLNISFPENPQCEVTTTDKVNRVMHEEYTKAITDYITLQSWLAVITSVFLAKYYEALKDIVNFVLNVVIYNFAPDMGRRALLPDVTHGAFEVSFIAVSSFAFAMMCCGFNRYIFCLMLETWGVFMLEVIWRWFKTTGFNRLPVGIQNFFNRVGAEINRLN